MPLKEYSAEEALRNLKTRTSLWPQRGKMNRKGLLPLPEVRPTFTINDEDKIFCIGSCFAQHAGIALQNCGCQVVSNTPNPYFDGHVGGANHLIRYNIEAILNEFRWALDPSFSFGEHLFLEDTGGFIDPYGHCHHKLHTLAFIKILRDFTFSVTRQLPQCRIVTITLGLVEVWFDKVTNLYTNIKPCGAALKKEPGRFVLRVLSYQDVLEALEQVHQLLSKFGHPDFKILLTTSPVPLEATFREQDVFVANAYSKSVQRAAIDEFLLRHSNVNYFPSYESMTLGNPDFVWKEDQRHVAEVPVSVVMGHVLNAYAPQRKVINHGLEEIRKLDKMIGDAAQQLTFSHMLNTMKENRGLRAELQRLQQENEELRRQVAGGAPLMPVSQS